MLATAERIRVFRAPGCASGPAQRLPPEEPARRVRILLPAAQRYIREISHAVLDIKLLVLDTLNIQPLPLPDRVWED